MSIRTLFILFSGLLFLSGCQNKKNKEPEVTIIEEEVPTEPFAKLVISPKIDLGVFEGSNKMKSTTLMLTNVGTDTLHIIGAQPDCDCTTIHHVDSIIPPRGNGLIELTLDLTNYPADTIYNEVAIISNDYQERVKRFYLVGVNK